MRRGSTRICGAHLKYVQLYKTSGHIFEKYKEGDFTPTSDVFEDSMFLFSSDLYNSTGKVKLKQKFQCRENIHDPAAFQQNKDVVVNKSEAYRGFQVFKTHINAEDFKVGLHNFETEIKLVRTQSKITDSFHLRVLPFSKSTSVVTLIYRKCSTIEFPSLPTGVTNLAQKVGSHICLREPVKGILPMITHLEISLLSNRATFDTSFLGNLIFHTNLCLSESRIGALHQSHPSTNRFTPCVGKKHNLGEDRLIWKGSLTTDLFIPSNNKIHISLSGKLFYTGLTLSSSENICADDCALKYRWFTDEQQGFVPRKYLDPNRKLKLFEVIGVGLAFIGSAAWTLNFINTQYLHRYVLPSRDVEGDYNEPTARTWFEADDICRKSNSHLPSIVSSEDIEDLKEYVRMASSSALITDIFIGIHSKVITRDS